MTMKTTRSIIAVTAVAVGLANGTAMAGPFSGFVGMDEQVDPFTEDSGFAIFGFNIAFAGNTPEAVKHFVAWLNATQKHSVQVGCNEVLRSSPVSVNSTVFEFCRNYRS
jgi:hypothetical protein